VDRLRLEVGFDGAQSLTIYLTPAVADDLGRALAGDSSGAFTFEAEDGQYTVVLDKVVYVKRFARESRVGFGASA
jgi:hypothetical protein